MRTLLSAVFALSLSPALAANGEVCWAEPYTWENGAWVYGEGTTAGADVVTDAAGNMLYTTSDLVDCKNTSIPGQSVCTDEAGDPNIVSYAILGDTAIFDFHTGEARPFYRTACDDEAPTTAEYMPGNASAFRTLPNGVVVKIR